MTQQTIPDIPDNTHKKRNILFITCDQRLFQPVDAERFDQPALEQLAARGVTFENHYISSAVCTPSRGVIYSGLAPQVTGIQEEMMFGWTPSLSAKDISIGTAMKQLGYTTAYFGKFELNRDIVFPQPGVDYSDALKRYGFDFWQPYGEVTGEKNQGYEMDGVICREGINWLQTNTEILEKEGKPWFLVLSFINPHDIFFAEVNPPGKQIQKGYNNEAIAPIPTEEYRHEWKNNLWRTLDEPLRSPGRPEAHREFHIGTEGVVGKIPIDHEDMWRTYNNFYLNLLRENDWYIGQVMDTLNKLDLWKDTVVVFTSDHGEIGGAHGGLRNKGPVSYEQNIHVPMIIVDPNVKKGGQKTEALTSHIDILPTLVGLTGYRKEVVEEITKKLPGRDFSTILTNPSKAPRDAVRPGVLFNYVGLSTIDGTFYKKLFENWSDDDGGFAMKPVDFKKYRPDLSKRGFVSTVFDGKYKFSRYYAPDKFNSPENLNDLLNNNDVELFDLENDQEEINNLALPLILKLPLDKKLKKKLIDLIMTMNAKLNELMKLEVGFNDDRFLPPDVRS